MAFLLLVSPSPDYQKGVSMMDKAHSQQRSDELPPGINQVDIRLLLGFFSGNHRTKAPEHRSLYDR
jgi:hypothetical protein